MNNAGTHAVVHGLGDADEAIWGTSTHCFRRSGEGEGAEAGVGGKRPSVGSQDH